MSNADWWAKKLNQPQSQPRRDVAPPMPPSQQPMTPYVPPQQQQPPQTKARSVAQVESCPECGSANYMSVQNAAPRCYDCGYPLSQSGSKYGTLQGARVESGVKAALGNDVQSNWNPQGIIGRVDG